MEDDTPQSDLADSQPTLPVGEIEPIPPGRVVLMGVLLEGALVLLALALGWLFSYWPLATFPGSTAGVIEGLWMGVVATVPLLVGLWLINRYPVGPFRDLKRIVDQMILPLFRGIGVWGFAAISVLAGLGEELLFRGFLQGALAEAMQDRFRPSSAHGIAVLAASALFGLMHPITKFYAVLCFGVGIYLGCLWLWTGNLLAPIVAHALYDFVALVYLTRSGSASEVVVAESS